jgi:hypothetical protein
MTTKDRGWQSSAAYLYVLWLDAAALAWEYLRRNADYCETWQRAQAQGVDAEEVARWGLRFP